MIRVGIVDDHALVRAGLGELLAHSAEVRIVGQGANGDDALELARTVVMDVLVMDISMPGKGAIDVLRSIRASAPALRILILSGHDVVAYGPSLLELGAHGYVGKGEPSWEIVAAILTVAKGGQYVSSQIREGETPADVNANVEPGALLSHRELQVLLKLARGDTTGEIALALALTPKTVSAYRSRLMKKLRTSSNSDLTRYALRHKLIV